MVWCCGQQFVPLRRGEEAGLAQLVDSMMDSGVGSFPLLDGKGPQLEMEMRAWEGAKPYPGLALPQFEC